MAMFAQRPRRVIPDAIAAPVLTPADFTSVAVVPHSSTPIKQHGSRLQTGEEYSGRYQPNARPSWSAYSRQEPQQGLSGPVTTVAAPLRRRQDTNFPSQDQMIEHAARKINKGKGLSLSQKISEDSLDSYGEKSSLGRERQIFVSLICLTTNTVHAE